MARPPENQPEGSAVPLFRHRRYRRNRTPSTDTSFFVFSSFTSTTVQQYKLQTNVYFFSFISRFVFACHCTGPRLVPRTGRSVGALFHVTGFNRRGRGSGPSFFVFLVLRPSRFFRVGEARGTDASSLGGLPFPGAVFLERRSEEDARSKPEGRR